MIMPFPGLIRGYQAATALASLGTPCSSRHLAPTTTAGTLPAPQLDSVGPCRAPELDSPGLPVTRTGLPRLAGCPNWTPWGPARAAVVLGCGAIGPWNHSLGVFLFCYADAAGEGGAGRELGGGRVVDLFEGQAVRRYDPDGRVPDRCR